MNKRYVGLLLILLEAIGAVVEYLKEKLVRHMFSDDGNVFA